MKELNFFERNVTIPNFIDSYLSSRRVSKSNPDWMPVNGLTVFCGSQGSGKTLSAVMYAYNILCHYPNAILCTNINVNFDIDFNLIPYEGVEQLVTLCNEPMENGVIFLLDEMHIEFNSLESKGMDSNIFELVSQQRKRRVHIVGTSQVFSRLAKPFREQFKYAVLCDNLIGSLFRQEVFKCENTAFDEDIRSCLHSCGRFYYFASPEMFAMYDTSQVVKRLSGGFKNGK